MKLYRETEKIFPTLEKLLTTEDLTEFANAPISDLHLYHFGLGRWIRNNLLYPEKSRLHKLFLENSIEHPNDMSSFMIKLFHCHTAKNKQIKHILYAVNHHCFTY